MPAFPRHSVQWHLQERTLLQVVTQSLAGYGIAIGAVVRLFRWGVLSIVLPASISAVLGTFALGAVLMCGLATAYFANFKIASWRWRAPALGALIALGEALTSLALIALHQERGGRELMVFGDWPGSAMMILLSRVAGVSLFALVLAGTVSALRGPLHAEPEKGATDVVDEA